MKKLFVSVLLTATLAVSPMFAARLIPFQARLTTASGAPVADGVYSVTFSIYDQPLGGVAVASEVQPSVSVVNGAVNVLVGSITDLSGLSFTQTRYLGIRVGTGQEMVPRHQLIPAFHAVKADGVIDNGISTTMITDGAITSGKIGDGAITTTKIAANAITNGLVAAGAIGSNEVADGSITANDLAPGAVTSLNLLDGAVTTSKLLDGAVTTTYNPPNSNQVVSSKLADGAVATSKIKDGAVTASKLDSAIAPHLRSEIRVDTSSSNGVYGHVKIFSNASVNVGSDISYVQLGDGDKFVINTDGTYSVSFSGSASAGDEMAISLNADSNLRVDALPQNKKLCVTFVGPMEQSNCSWTGHLSATDFVKAQQDGPSSGYPNNNIFSIVRLSN